MENFWQKAKSLAEEAARRSQTLTTSPVRISDIVAETAKRSKDIAAGASKKADEFKTAALLSIADQIPALSVAAFSTSSSSESPSELELEEFGITQDLRDFVKGLTLSTFQNFPFQDDLASSDVATVSNVTQDLSEWQQKHANLVLTAVKEVSKLRYELCPRHMKDRRFWRIYFTLVSTHVSPYEKKYAEESKLKQIAETKDEITHETPVDGPEVVGSKLKSKNSTSEQDLDSYLLGDLDDSDGHPDDDDNDKDVFDDDDFDKIDNSEIEDEK